jgi:uncharacterized Zn finger protein
MQVIKFKVVENILSCICSVCGKDVSFDLRKIKENINRTGLYIVECKECGPVITINQR